MKAFVFLASIFILLSQSQVQAYRGPDLTDFFKKFVSRLPISDPDMKAKIESDGLACLDLTSHSIQAFHFGDISSLKELTEAIEGSLLPKCIQTYQQIISFFESSANLSQINSPAKFAMWRAKLIQIGARVFIELSQNQTLDAAQDLNLFLETAFGLIRVYLPPTLQFNSTKSVAFNQEKAVPLFLKGFFDTLDIQDQSKINGTIQCLLGITNSIQERKNFLTQTNLFLDAYERCNQMEKISLESVQDLIQTILSHPKESLIKMAGSTIMKLPEITQSQINMKVYLKQGEYELVGQQFAINLLRIYQGLLL